MYGPTGSDYLFITFSGKLHGISLVTGQEVFKVERPRDRYEDTSKNYFIVPILTRRSKT